MKIRYAVVFFAVLFAVIAFKNYEPEPRYVDYVVNSGDTLWSIADQSDIDTDKRAIVAYMMDKSDIKQAADLRPGMVVQVPMLK